ncbi:cilia- and flagella-associated protein 184 [Halichoeres trimaculatus]|uniref:cilia- and flagella-associated protein 184 n=1 Tax=Halichoeres trimaculatus TaxID=147232 RepID=UPI003D9F5DFD
MSGQSVQRSRSYRLTKQAAQARVESTLAAEQLHQEELIKVRLKHLSLRSRIHRLEAVMKTNIKTLSSSSLSVCRLSDGNREDKLRAEESVKIQKKINSILEPDGGPDQEEQLAEVEATLARKRELLTRNKRSHNNLQRDNQRLRGGRGLLGDMVLLRDLRTLCMPLTLWRKNWMNPRVSKRRFLPAHILTVVLKGITNMYLKHELQQQICVSYISNSFSVPLALFRVAGGWSLSQLS